MKIVEAQIWYELQPNIHANEIVQFVLKHWIFKEKTINQITCFNFFN